MLSIKKAKRPQATAKRKNHTKRQSKGRKANNAVTKVEADAYEEVANGREESETDTDTDRGISVADGRKAAELCALNLIAQMKSAVGDLTKV